MKKRALLLTLLLLVLCLSACGESSETTNKGTADSTTQGHIHYYTNATCTDPAICSCGRTKGSALGHEYSEATCTAPKFCNRCDVIVSASLGHEYSEATCTEPKICSRCQASGGSALGHDYSEATCTTPKICNRCQVIASAELGHDYTNATCTAAEICKRCEDVKGTPLGHEYNEATCLLPMTCTRCQGTKDSALGHTYVDNKCIRCEEIDPESLPVAVDKLHVINSKRYEVVAPLTDTYGYTYDSGIVLTASFSNDAFVTYNLEKKYTQLSGSIVAPSDQLADGGGMDNFSIWVDDVCVFSVDHINRETAKIDFSIDITYATKLKFGCRDNWSSMANLTIAIVNAQVQK
ncbi:MAG: NPCBM/NEW2 domain-containing protein [Clostridia bacterium]|nr:NPCBM/NEW2 domain-containing protein [Clostridia bacterium]